ncbi:MAG: hypothetical protein AAGE13_14510, partial [Pseudomonadota bacterium]
RAQARAGTPALCCNPGAIAFYRMLGAETLAEKTYLRLSGAALDRTAGALSSCADGRRTDR